MLAVGKLFSAMTKGLLQQLHEAVRLLEGEDEVRVCDAILFHDHLQHSRGTCRQALKHRRRVRVVCGWCWVVCDGWVVLGGEWCVVGAGVSGSFIARIKDDKRASPGM